MTNMQQLYAAHLENVKHNREMERLTEQQNQTERDKAEEQRRHNEKTEELSKYQADTSAAATRYTAEQRNEGTHYQADTSASASKYSADKTQENTKIKGRYDIRKTQLDNQAKQKLTTQSNYVQATGNYLKFLTDMRATAAQMSQARTAAKNADYNAMVSVADMVKKQAEAKKLLTEKAKIATDNVDHVLDIIGKLWKAAGAVTGGNE